MYTIAVMEDKLYILEFNEVQFYVGITFIHLAKAFMQNDLQMKKHKQIDITSRGHEYCY